MPVPQQRHEGRCDRCGGVNPVWSVDNDLWNAFVRMPEGSDRWSFLCPSCFASVAEEATGTRPRWRFYPIEESEAQEQPTGQEEPTVSVCQPDGYREHKPYRPFGSLSGPLRPPGPVEQWRCVRCGDDLPNNPCSCGTEGDIHTDICAALKPPVAR